MGTSRTTIAVIAAFSTVLPGAALPQGSAGSSGTTYAAAGAAPTTATTAATTAATPATGTVGQPAAPIRAGLQVDLGISSKLTVDDNFQLQPNSAGTSTIWDNTLTFGLSSVTAVHDFDLSGSGVLRTGHIPGRSLSGFEDPTLRLRYRLDGINSQLTVTGRYRYVEREFLDPFQVEQEEVNAGTFYAGGGTVTFRNAGLNYVTGINDPLTFTLDLLHDEKSYDTAAILSNARLFDNETDKIGASVALKVSPVTSVSLNASVADYSADDTPQTDRTTTDYAIGLVQDINPVLVLSARIGHTEVETDTTTGTTRRSGATGSTRLTQTLANGTAYGDLTTSLNQNGTRTTLSFGRDLQLPLGTFAASLGGTRTPSGDVHTVATLAYSRQMKASDLTVALNRSVATNNVNQDELDTRLTVNYGYEINNNSRLDFTLNWGRTESAGVGGAPTIDRTSLRAAYTRDLTQDWALTGGVLLRERDDATLAGSAQSNALFLTLGRTFSYRP